MRTHDWSASPLGPPASWPQSLHSVVSLMLGSKFPMWLAWGEELPMLYNDAYAEILGSKHPAALGTRLYDVWAEIRSDIAPLIEAVLAGEAIYREDLPLAVNRRGLDEQAWFTFSYSAVHDETGSVAGVFCAVSETTGRVLADRRQAFRLGLEDELRSLADPREVIACAAAALGRHFGAVRVGYAEIEPDGIHSRIEQDWCAEGAASMAGRYRLNDYGLTRMADYAAGRTVAVDDFATDPRSAGTPVVAAYAGHGVRAQAVVPLVKAGRLAALLFVHMAQSRRWTQADLLLIEDVGERTWAAVGRSRAEATLRDSETRLRVAVEAGRIGEWELDLGTDNSVRALRHDQIFGYDGPVENWGFEAFIRHVVPEDRKSVEAAFQTATETGAGWHFECRIRRADNGEVRWIAAHSAVQFDASGRATKLFGLVQDITQGKAAVERLRDLNGMLAQRVAEVAADLDRAWRNASDIFIVIDRDGVFRRVNPAATRILGWSEDELLGKPIFDFIHNEDKPATLAALEHTRTNSLPTFVNRYPTKDGGLRTISWLASPEGPFIYAYGRDVTAERERQAELEAAQEALRQAHKMEAVGQLTGGLAHDFNNLLAGISGSLELLQARVAQGRIGDLERYLVAAQGATKRAAALTHRLLAFSRRQTLDPKPTDANRLVVGIEELIRRTVGPEVAVEVVAAGGLWATLVDPNQLENALLNLAINARDAMPGGGQLTVETGNKWLDERAALERDLEPGQYVTLSVSDTGAGMVPEVAARAFDPFFTTKPIGMGTGLGLSMVYGFVRQSGGQARIYSEPSQGTTVCLYLPRHHGEVEDTDRPAEANERARAEQGETVLVVDDEPTVRMLVTEVLADLGYTAVEAADGPSGLRVLQSNVRIDLLVTDVGLPGMNGRQVADAARVARPGLKVLFITGYAENAVLSHGHLDPGMHVMTKPFAIDALTSRIRELIAGP